MDLRHKGWNSVGQIPQKTKRTKCVESCDVLLNIVMCVGSNEHDKQRPSTRFVIPVHEKPRNLPVLMSTDVFSANLR